MKFEVLIHKHLITFLCLFLLNSLQIKSQDVQFSQIKPNLIIYNPAFAGFDKCTNIGLSYRNQWIGIDNGYNSLSANYNQYLNFLHGGIGLYIIKDVAGQNVFNNTSVNGMYSFHFKVNRKLSAAMSMQFSYFQYNLNSQNLIYSDMLDQLYGAIYPTGEILINRSEKFGNFSSGILLYNKKYFFGFSINHLQQINITPTEMSIPVKYSMQAGAKFSFDKLDLRSEQFSLSPIIIYQQQKNIQNFKLGLYFNKNFYSFGILLQQSFLPYLSNDAIILDFGVKIKYGNNHKKRQSDNHSSLLLNYSYDISTNKLWKNTYGTHEISIIFRFNCKEKKKKNTIICPAYKL